MHGDGRRNMVWEYGTGKGRRWKRTVLGSEKGAGNKIIEVKNKSSANALETLI